MSELDEYSSIDILKSEGKELTGAPIVGEQKTYGRGAHVDALARALMGRTSAVLLGPSGVGKTAIIRKLLHYIRSGRIEGLASAEVFEMSTAALCSGTRYTGMQEGKIQALLKRSTPDRFLYVPDLWNITTAVSYETNPRGIYDLMRPGIESGDLVLIGEMSQGRWDKLCREHATLERDFATITVEETTEEETREILWRAAGDLGRDAVVEKSAIERVWTLARKFMPMRSFPGKGVDLLRRVAAAARPGLESEGRTSIDVGFVESVFGAESGLPMHMISPSVLVTYDEMRDFLGERVVGQPDAITAVADVLALYKTGLSNPDRPAGVLLFVGPTGVGKTELAKATAAFLFGSPDRMLRVDLSEYKDYHSFEKLIGDPRQGTSGILTDHIRQQPFSVVLLDEFEKGHANIADLFLQVFDDGRLTDASGETMSFRHALMILTSNAGSDVQEGGGIGFSDAARNPHRGMEARIKKALESAYRPEFLNRIDRILVFRPLGKEDMRRIARRELGKVYQREGLLERDLLLEVDDGVIDLLLEVGFDPKYGARPLKRAIEEHVMIPLARALLSAQLRRFQLLRLARAGDGVELSLEETETSRKLENLEKRSRTSDGEGGIVEASLEEVRVKLREIAERLQKLRGDGRLDRMRTELAELHQAADGPAFWDRAFGDTKALVRRHVLSAELDRFRDLEDRLDLIRELVEASFDEGEDSVAKDLTTEYARLLRKLERVEIEWLFLAPEDHGDALVTLRPVGGKAQALGWAEELARMYRAWAEERGYEVDQHESEDELRLRIGGGYALGYLRGEAGGHRVIRPPSHRGGQKAETLLVRVEVAPAEGGDARSGDASYDEPPIRTYDLWRSHGVRDRRTGHADGDAKRVLAGRLEGFLVAWLRSGAASAA